jgi:hypothetical protein
MPDQMKLRTRGIGWGVWWRWVVATVLGSAVGWGLAAFILLTIGFSEKASETTVGRSVFLGSIGVCFGAATATAQLLVLRRHLNGLGMWVWASVVAYGVGLAATGVLEAVTSLGFGALTGFGLTAIAAGVLQWLVLRGRVVNSWWWAPASAFAFYSGTLVAISSEPALASLLGLAKPAALGQGIGGVAFTFAVGGVLGLVFGVVTGTVLVMLLRRTASTSWPARARRASRNRFGISRSTPCPERQ